MVHILLIPHNAKHLVPQTQNHMALWIGRELGSFCDFFPRHYLLDHTKPIHTFSPMCFGVGFILPELGSMSLSQSMGFHFPSIKCSQMGTKLSQSQRNINYQLGLLKGKQFLLFQERAINVLLLLLSGGVRLWGFQLLQSICCQEGNSWSCQGVTG